jgi:hypothetical protein
MNRATGEWRRYRYFQVGYGAAFSVGAGASGSGYGNSIVSGEGAATNVSISAAFSLGATSDGDAPIGVGGFGPRIGLEASHTYGRTTVTPWMRFDPDREIQRRCG